MTSVAADDLIAALATFWRWWTDELKGTFTRPFRGSAKVRKPYLRLEIGAETTILRACMKRRDPELVRADVRIDSVLESLGERRFLRWPIVICLESSLGLIEQVDLPYVPMQDVPNLLKREFDRLTAFDADDVYYAWRLLKESKEKRHIQIRLEAVPKVTVKPVLSAIERLGRAPASMELVNDGKQPSLDLLQFEALKRSKTKRKPSIFPPLSLGLMIIAGALPLRQQTVMIEQLRAEVEHSRDKAEQSAALRKRFAEHEAERVFLLKERDQLRTVTEVLQALTMMTPNDGQITLLEIRPSQVSFVGRVESASDLIGALERSPLFDTPRFQSPIAFDPKTKKEQFAITADIKRVVP